MTNNYWPRLVLFVLLLLNPASRARLSFCRHSGIAPLADFHLIPNRLRLFAFDELVTAVGTEPAFFPDLKRLSAFSTSVEGYGLSGLDIDNQVTVDLDVSSLIRLSGFQFLHLLEEIDAKLCAAIVSAVYALAIIPVSHDSHEPPP
ncbi:hypothetical protein HY045_01460 [Candidatus Woesebacteria bacterium]|nr:hypothetical protein [Candidatus Woesebacteria bacterium]